MAITRKAIRANWIKRLRSGKYKQGRMRLKGADSETGETRYCCLGVLCEFLEEKGMLRSYKSGGSYVFTDGYEESTSYLTEKAKTAAGLISCGGVGIKGGSLTSLNDQQCCCFSEIADALEEGYYWEENQK